MIQLDTTVMKKIQIEIMDKVFDFCNNNNLKVYLGFGTLLGAVRHKGYIPWDDDIDLIMNRNDYDWFLNNFNRSNAIYKVRHLQNDEKYLFSFAKVEDSRTIMLENTKHLIDIGINIDIFPIDGVGSKKYKIDFFLTKYIYRLIDIKSITKNKKRGFIKETIRKVLQIAPYSCKKLLIYQNRIMKKHNFSDSQFATIYSMGMAKLCIAPKAYYTEEIELTFESKKYRAPKHFDKILKVRYGDYLSFPPLIDQVTHHSFKAYFKEKA